MIALSRLGAQLLSHRNELEAIGRRDVARIEDAYKWFEELQRYVYSNIGSLMDYGQAWRDGERMSTANIESTVNQLINQRMCKKCQMRWSRLGAQLILHVRTAYFNGRLERFCGLSEPIKWTLANDNEFLKAAVGGSDEAPENPRLQTVFTHQAPVLHAPIQQLFSRRRLAASFCMVQRERRLCGDDNSYQFCESQRGKRNEARGIFPAKGSPSDGTTGMAKLVGYLPGLVLSQSRRSLGIPQGNLVLSETDRSND